MRVMRRMTESVNRDTRWLSCGMAGRSFADEFCAVYHAGGALILS
jgi:hypothetical protein